MRTKQVRTPQLRRALVVRDIAFFILKNEDMPVILYRFVSNFACPGEEILGMASIT